jgi:hypothetical protein
MSVADRFPQPTKPVRVAFARLRVACSGDEEAIAALGPVADLPRPWDPSRCPSSLRHALWLWLDAVAGWINHDYSWQAESCIPGCWPAHPHIAHELAVVAALRFDAGQTLTADALDEWHCDTLPGFLHRMTSRLGGNGCPPGKHHDWPGAGRHHDYESAPRLDWRLDVFLDDVRLDE